MGVDSIVLNLNPNALKFLNIILALVMFGVALDMKVQDFKDVTRKGKGPIIGVLVQFLVLPAATWGLTMIFRPSASIAMGMILVAACPGGNVSNFITHLSKGNTALSVSMTAISTALATFMTPLNLAFWGKLNPDTAKLLSDINLNAFDMIATVFIVLGAPLALGLFISHRYPQFAEKAKGKFKLGSVIFFTCFIVIAFANNFSNFINYIHYIALLVLLHNATAFTLGYWLARLGKLSHYDSKAVSIEVGIQNSGLGLVLIFTFFHGLGGMALIAAWWGIWHLVAGLSLATYWSKKEKRLAT